MSFAIFTFELYKSTSKAKGHPRTSPYSNGSRQYAFMHGSRQVTRMLVSPVVSSFHVSYWAYLDRVHCLSQRHEERTLLHHRRRAFRLLLTALKVCLLETSISDFGRQVEQQRMRETVVVTDHHTRHDQIRPDLNNQRSVPFNANVNVVGRLIMKCILGLELG